MGGMLTETMIRRLIPEILANLGGAATKSEIVEYIIDNYQLDAVLDRSMSASRNEEKFVQRVGNIVSHARKELDYVEFIEGFALVKIVPDSRYPDRVNWLFVLPDKSYAPVSPSNILAPKPGGVSHVQKGRIVPWGVIQAKREAVGKAGELFVYNQELDWVETHYPSELNRVEWSSQIHGDGLGYDVRSIAHDNPNNDLLLEVKTTSSSSPNTVFQMSPNELNMFKSALPMSEILQLHRLYKPNNDMSVFERRIISQFELLRDYDCVPQSYNMRLR